MRRAAGSVLIVALAAVAPGCALQPRSSAFPMMLPERLAADRPLAVVGDLQITSGFVRFVTRHESNEREQIALMADLERRAGDIAGLVIVGDLVYTAASRRDWRWFDELIAPLANNVPVLPAIGNHDYYCVFVQRCLQRVVPRSFRLRFPWFAPGQPYAVAYGDVMLAFLDSETDLAAQGAWLAQRLDEWRTTYRAVLVFLHRPPFTNSVRRGAHPDTDVQLHVVSRLASTRLAASMVAGHIHGYEHFVVDGIHYITTAGGGGPRGLLGAERPNDVYAGRECLEDAFGQVLRPFNYLLIDRRPGTLHVTVRGFCRAGAVEELESFDIPVAEVDNPTR